MLRTLVNGLLDLLWPPRSLCLLCQQRLDEEAAGSLICRICWDEMAFAPNIHRCANCARPLAGLGAVCEQCQLGAAYGRVYALGLHEGALREAVHHLKFGGRTTLAPILGQRLATTIPDRFDVAIGVPLHPRRQRGRGFNQAALLAEAVAAPMGIPVIHGAVIRRVNTKPQADLEREARLANVAGAFGLAVAEPAPWVDKSVLIVDDVLTTGATLTAVAEVLRQTGARQVSAAVLAVSTLRIEG